VCFVGRPATTSEDEQGYVERTQRLLTYLASQPDVKLTAATLTKEFKPRERVERVRNCTQLDRALVRGIVSQVVGMCLAAADERRQVVVAASGNSTWNAGGSLALDVVAARLAQSGWDLSRLKAECGGLQTLLRNHHAVFTVRGGAVRLRVPGEDAAAAAGRRTAPKQRANAAAVSRLKTKACWHFVHHPDGCPLTSETCSWLHMKDVES
jgi:tRNASer (uridine44-2'-O)-methyltransferase